MSDTRTLIDGNMAIHENENYTTAWQRKPVAVRKPAFDVEVYIEGFRPTKDVWLHDTYSFDTLDEALTFLENFSMMPTDEFQEFINDSNEWSYKGWYGYSFEYAKIFEYTESGEKYEWERVRS